MSRIYGKEKRKKHFTETLADFSFFAWIILTFFLERSGLGRVALLVFSGSIVLFMFLRVRISEDVTSKRTIANLYFLSYILFIAYNYWHINYTELVIDKETAQSMFKTIYINLLFIYCVYRYCLMKGSMDYILDVYVKSNMIVMTLIIAISGKDLLSGRLGGAAGINANVVALAMINCLLIVMHKNTYEKKKKNIIIMLICIGAILLTGSRKGLIGMALALVLYQGMTKGFKKYKNLLIAAIVVVIAYYLIMNIEPLYNIAGHRVEALLSYFKGESYNEASLDSRDKIAELGWKYVAKNPIYGYGLGNFSVMKGSFGLYSHNNYLELMFGCGLIGTVLYYLGYAYILFGHLKLYLVNKVEDSKPYIIIMIIRIFLEYAYVSYFERTSILFVVISLAALHISKIKLKNGVRENEKIKESTEKSV